MELWDLEVMRAVKIHDVSVRTCSLIPTAVALYTSGIVGVVLECGR